MKISRIERRGEFQKAIEERTQLLKEQESLAGPDHPGTLSSEYALAKDLAAAGQPEAGMTYATKAVVQARALLGPDAPFVRDVEALIASLRAAAAQPTPVSLNATVTAVEGFAQVRDGQDKPWVPCTIGRLLGPTAEFRTGPRGLIRLTLPPDQVVTVDRMTSISLAQVVRTSGGKVKTDLVMPRGKAEYEIEAPDLAHEPAIRSPNSTL